MDGIRVAAHHGSHRRRARLNFSRATCEADGIERRGGGISPAPIPQISDFAASATSASGKLCRFAIGHFAVSSAVTILRLVVSRVRRHEFHYPRAARHHGGRCEGRDGAPVSSLPIL